MINKKFSKLRLLIDTKKYSVTYISKYSGVTIDTILKYADSGMKPTVKPALLIAKLFGVSPWWLWIDSRENINDYEVEQDFVKQDL